MRELYKLSPDFREQQVGNWTAVYNRHWGGLCLLDAEARQFALQFAQIRAIQNEGTSSEGVFVAANSPEERLFQQLAMRKLMIPVSEEAREADRYNPLAEGLYRLQDLSATKPPVSSSKINVVQLVVVNGCNFGCTYCFEGAQGADLSHAAKQDQSIVQISNLSSDVSSVGDKTKVNLQNSVYASEERFKHQRASDNRLMRPEQAVEYIRKAISIAKDSGTSRLMVQFFGGEPMLNWPAVRAVLQAFQHGEDHGIQIDYTIVTNGSLIKEDVAKAFREYQVGVCVSFDSPESESRPLKNGADSRPIVFKALRILQRHGVRVAMNVALSGDTWNTFGPALVDFALDYGIHEIGVVVDLDPGFYSRFGSTGITEKLWSLVAAGMERDVVVTGYWHQIFQLLSGFAVISQRGFKNCSATGAQLSIEPDGSVFSCKAGSGKFGSIGDENLLQTSTYRKHANLRQDNPAFCSGCEIEGFCAGLCLGPREKAYGTINNMEPAACDFYRQITRRFIGSQTPYEVATFDLASARAAQCAPELAFGR